MSDEENEDYDNDNPKYIKPAEASKILSVTRKTLNSYAERHDLRFIRTQGGHYRYLYDDVINLKKFLNPSSTGDIKSSPSTGGKEDNRKRYCYARVSSHGQKEDLERQIQFFQHKYPNHIIIKDIGSGLNFKRKGFNALVEQAIQGNIKEIIITHKDRLCRFGFDLVEKLISTYSNGKILVLNQSTASPQEELVNDLISIITVFSSKIHGLRSGILKKEIKEQIREKERNREIKNIENTITS